MIDTVAERGWLTSTLRITQLFQMIVQARWIDDSAIMTLPHIRTEDLRLFLSFSMALPMLCSITYDNYNRLAKILREGEYRVDQIREVIKLKRYLSDIYYLHVIKNIILNLY